MQRGVVMDIKPENMTEELMLILNGYVADINENVEIAADMCSKECLQDIKEDSPVNTGEYRKGWKRKKKGHGCVVYNSKKPELTYPLEKGHLKSNHKGRVPGHPHIEANGKRLSDRFYDLCVDIVAGLRFKK